MSREAHVQFCEGLAGQFRWSTLLVVMARLPDDTAQGIHRRHS